ncbi:hypothetical protein F2P81_025341 [Scophthalmus maximus]|uniref:Uncharacterized protein n=1 Tax=Scophthalmus maximus TaxID=52904 RepID=A0A6A4RSQ8_SCOMX|nr:hypothetical protein F2P81_025341 [Scophthalmus maximus]
MKLFVSGGRPYVRPRSLNVISTRVRKTCCDAASPRRGNGSMMFHNEKPNESDELIRSPLFSISLNVIMDMSCVLRSSLPSLAASSSGLKLQQETERRDSSAPRRSQINAYSPPHGKTNTQFSLTRQPSSFLTAEEHIDQVVSSENTKEPEKTSRCETFVKHFVTSKCARAEFPYTLSSVGRRSRDLFCFYFAADRTSGGLEKNKNAAALMKER